MDTDGDGDGDGDALGVGATGVAVAVVDEGNADGGPLVDPPAGPLPPWAVQADIASSAAASRPACAGKRPNTGSVLGRGPQACGSAYWRWRLPSARSFTPPVTVRPVSPAPQGLLQYGQGLIELGGDEHEDGLGLIIGRTTAKRGRARKIRASTDKMAETYAGVRDSA